MLGLGTKYKDYSSKTDAYYKFLYNGITSTGPEQCTQSSGGTENNARHTCDEDYISPPPGTPIPDDDIVLFMDAFDVLVFPALRNAAKVLSESPKPILFCAERGIYPEFHGTNN